MSIENEEAEEVGSLETKAERFKRVANYRLTTIRERTRLMRRMFEGANKNNYEWSDDQADRLIAALQSEVDKIAALVRVKPDEEIEL